MNRGREEAAWHDPKKGWYAIILIVKNLQKTSALGHGKNSVKPGKRGGRQTCSFSGRKPTTIGKKRAVCRSDREKKGEGEETSQSPSGDQRKRLTVFPFPVRRAWEPRNKESLNTTTY